MTHSSIPLSTATEAAGLAKPMTREVHTNPGPAVYSPVRRVLRATLMGILLLLASVASILLPTQRRIDIVIGEASAYDIKAPAEVSYISDVDTRMAREDAARRVADVYTSPDLTLATQQLDRLAALHEGVIQARAAAGLPQAERLNSLAEMPEVDLTDDAWATALRLGDSRWEALAEESERVLNLIMRSEIRPTDLTRARLDIQRLMAHTLTLSERDVVNALLIKLIVPNTFLDTEATEFRRQEARATVAPTVRTIRQGESILREGAIVTEQAYEKLAVLGLLNQQVDWRGRIAEMGMALLVVVIMVVYMMRVYPDLIYHPRRQLLLVSILILVTLTSRLLFPGHALVPYLFPGAAAAMLVTLFLNIELGTLIAIVTALIVGSSNGGSLELAVYILLGGLVGALLLMHSDQLSRFFVAIAGLAVVNIATLLLFRVQGDNFDTLALLQLTGAGALNGLFSGTICFMAYVFTGRLFGITTSLQLMELARPTHPLFRQLLIKAPGTYHHSILIANMAEQAAEAIGADALLTRVGSYYHDVGKILRPYFFTENQSEGQNPHDSLDPQTSAEVIIGHAREGVELAKRYRLPDKVASFIPEHHGTTLAAYFYRKAAQAHEGDEGLDESPYRYPGPKPQSRETAIVMLADAVEAWSRANRPSTQAEMERLIRQVINDRLISGQLDDTDLTLKDLDRIRQAFGNILRGVYHPRIQYPERAQTRKGSATKASA